MRHLSIDIETFSSVSLPASGVHKYVASPDFQVILFAYSWDFGPVTVLDLMQGDILPQDVVNALYDPQVIKHAYNASFEWNALNSKGFGLYFRLPAEQWQCTMVHGLYCGLTAGLSVTGKVLGLPDDRQKYSTGSALIKTFCIPTEPTARNGYRTRTLPHHEPEKWLLFKDYCRQDVVTEMEIERRLSAFPVPEGEQRLWALDQYINARGVAVSLPLIDGALHCDQVATDALMAEAMQISGLANPKSIQQLTAWLQDETGDEVTDLTKANVADLVGTVTSDAARRMLEIRQETSKTSTKKYASMREAVGEDGRVRGLLQFYGANRTGRFAGRLVQVQNLPRNHMDTLGLARDLVIGRKLDAIRIIYGNVPDTLSQLIRTAFIPSTGNRFIVADFSAIEARVIAWLAGEEWRMDVFRTHGKIYEASASAMFGVPIEKIKKGNPEYDLRQKGKIAELALGYQGSKGALITMGALRMGLTDEELPDIVTRWRGANKRIVDLWYGIENAAMSVMQSGLPVAIRGLVFAREADVANNLDFLTIQLPVGRKLFYAMPRLVPSKFKGEALQYMGLNQETKKWGPVDTYGGKLVENIVQAIARDCLTASMQAVELAGYPIVMHVHDEVILDMPEGFGSLDEATAIMGRELPWAPGLPLRADGYECEWYRKE